MAGVGGKIGREILYFAESDTVLEQVNQIPRLSLVGELE